MALASQFEIGKTYNFTVYGNNIVGSSYSNMVVAGIIDPQTALELGTDIAALHAQIYPSLPDPKPTNAYNAYNYVKFKNTNDISNKTIVLGLPWINEASVTLVGAQTRVVTITNTTVSDESVILAALAANGYSATITVQS